MSGINSGKEAEMISRNSTREILLNMFDRSKKTAARVGGVHSFGGTPKARQPLMLSCLSQRHALTCIQVELSPPFV
jgi:hypothetical protein